MSEAMGGGICPAGMVEVQPREILEDVFRALCAQGADPAEAREGGQAVLTAEIEGGGGLARLDLILGAGRSWRRSQQATVHTRRTADQVLSRLECHGQPALRTMLQLVDLACAYPHAAMSIAYTTDQVDLPSVFWHDVLARRGAVTGRAVHLIRGSAPVENALTGRGEVVDRALRLCGDAGAAVVCGLGGELLPSVSLTRHEPVCVDQHDWDRLIEEADRYLVPEGDRSTI